MSILVDPVVYFVLESLGKWLIEEARLIKGVSGKVEEIERELKRMKCFLIDAADHQTARSRGRGQSSHNWVLDVQDIAYHAEDVIETYMLKLAYYRGRGFKILIKRYTTGLLNQFMLRHNIGMEIKVIKSRLCEVRESLQTYGVRTLTEEEALLMTGGGGGGQRQRPLLLWRKTFSHDDENHFVGLHQDVEKLVGILILNGEDHTSVCICGMGGLGKTTLAKKFYNHPNVKRGFNCFAWICISQQCDTNAVWQDILIQLTSKKVTDVKEMTESQLVQELRLTLQNKRCLIVIDDIWLSSDWELLKQALPIGKTGGSRSKILLTSRNKSMASHVGAYLHEPRLLDNDEAWQLVHKKAFSNTNVVAADSRSYDRKVELGREMVKQCGGLPLGLVMLGGILGTKAECWEWEEVKKNVSSRISRGEGIGQENSSSSGVTRVLELSYAELPHQLKPCFLCLGNFREDSVIEAEELYHMWIAEGMVLRDDRAEGETMVEVAERYLNELAQRCMVQVKLADDIFSGKFESCSLHDLMRQLCLSKASQENFLKLMIHFRDGIDSNSLSASSQSFKTRRLAIYVDESGRRNENYEYELEYEKDDQQTRSLLLSFGGYGKLKSSYLQNFKVLRVLHLSRVSFAGNTMEAIAKLIHLRWLRLRRCDGAVIPPCIANLKCLQILDFRNNFEIWVPNVLWKMRSLRHLYLGVRSKTSGKNSKRQTWRLDSLSELETLEFSNTNYIDVEDLFKLTSLRKLEATIDGNNLEGMINYLCCSGNQLKHSSLQIVQRFSSEQDSSLLELFTCHHLNKLFITRNIEKLPKHPNLSPNLTQLTLTLSKLKDDPIAPLEKLPELRLLSLYGAFEGQKMVCSRMGFPKLKRLLLSFLTNLEEWRVDEDAMPNLYFLEIHYCRTLQMLPDGLRFITTLQELRIRDMPEAFRRRLKVVNGEAGADLYKVKHVPSLIII